MKFVQTVLLSVVAMSLVRGQTATQVDLRTQAKSVDFSSAITTKPLKSGSILPATCSVGDMYYKTDAPAGGNVYGCVALNTWALQSGGALGGDVSGPANAATVTQIQGRAIAATAPSGGQALTWNGSTSRWEPQTVSGGSGNATQLQGRNVATVMPSDTNVLCWSTTNSSWGPCASGGITNPFTFPGKFTAAASGVGAASFAIPAGVAPSTPSAGDVWNVAGALQFHNGSAAKTIAFVDSSITGTAAGITGKTAQGNGSLLLLGSGSYATGNVTSIDANGNVVDGGLAVANIVRTGSTYADPGWISSLAPAKVGNGTAQWNANQINGTSLAGLGTGLLKNTTGTGVPSIAVAADLPSHAARHQSGGNDEIGAATPAANAIPKAGSAGTLAAGWLPAPAISALGGVRSVDCSAGGQFVQKINTDGTETCATPAGGGNVSGPGSSTAGNLPQWNGTSGTSLTAGLAVSATPAANAVVEAGPGATIAAGWIPDLSGTYQAAAGKNAANGYAGLDAGSRIAKAQAPAATVYTDGSYADPGWITSLAASKVGNATAQWNANKINGTTLSALGSGLLKNTTGTGVPSIAVASDIPDLSATYSTKAAGGDLSGTLPSPTVTKINGTALSGLATGILKNTTTTGVPSIAVGTGAVSNADYIAPSILTSSQDILYRNGTDLARLPIVSSGKCLGNTGGLWASLDCSGGSMTYPGAGLPISTGSAWGTSLTPGAAGHVVRSNGSAYSDSALQAGDLPDLSNTDLTVKSLSTSVSGGLGGTLTLPEGTAPTAVAGKDLCYGDAAAHAILCSWNGGTFYRIPLLSNTSNTLPVANLPSGLDKFVVSGPTIARTYTLPDGNKALMATDTPVQTTQMPALTGDCTTAAGAVAVTCVQSHPAVTAITVSNSPYSVAAGDSMITCDASGGAVTINLPAATATHREITVKKLDSSANACTPTRAGSDTIDGATTLTLSVQYASAKVVDTASAVWSRTHVNQLSGDLSGTSASATVTKVNGQSLPTSASFVGTDSSGRITQTTLSRALSFSLGSPTASTPLTTSDTDYLTVPFSCTIAAYNLAIDAADATFRVKLWKVGTGTAIPTVSNSISTSGWGVPSGTAIHSTTLTDLSASAVTANDIIAVNVSTANTVKFINLVLQCNQ